MELLELFPTVLDASNLQKVCKRKEKGNLNKLFQFKKSRFQKVKRKHDPFYLHESKDYTFHLIGGGGKEDLTTILFD